MGRPVGHYKGGRGGEVHTVRHRYGTGCVCNDLLGKTTNASECDHPVTYTQVIHSLTDLFDDAGNLVARRERKGRPGLIFTLNDECVGEVHAASFHIDDHLALAWLL